MTPSLRCPIAALTAAVSLALTPGAAPAMSGLLTPQPAPAVSVTPVAAAASADPAGPVRGTIILIHGGGWAGHDAAAQRHLLEHPGPLFLQRNWRVVSIDYNAGANGLQDLLDTAGQELTRRTGNGPLCLYGESSGAHLALIAASRLRAIDCVIGLGAPTDLVNYHAEAAASTEPRAKLVAGRIAQYFGTTATELAPWDPVTLASRIRADVVLLREGDDAVFSTVHAQRMQTARPTTQSVHLEPGEPAQLSSALLHGTVSAAGRAAFAATLGAFTDRAVSSQRAERAAERTNCRWVARSLHEIELRGLRDAIRCLARRRPRRLRGPRDRAATWQGTQISLRGEINAARIWSKLRASQSGSPALSALAGGRARLTVRSGQRSRITIRPGRG